MRQAAAFPYRLVEGSNGSSGSIELLLVTTGSGRWIIPKGDVDHGMAPHLAAEKEAFEEGGVRGRIQRHINRKLPPSQRIRMAPRSRPRLTSIRWKFGRN